MSGRRLPPPRTEDRRRRAERLRLAGLKATGPRLTILEALERDRRHPTAEMIHDALRAGHPSLSLSTVYSTLETFLHKGLVRRITGRGGKLRVDGTMQDHDHAVCRSCGEVFDVDPDFIQRPRMPSELPQGLRVTNLYVEYEVLCARCSSEG
jgi:Fur family peroxide stress response transcriptional regulator